MISGCCNPNNAILIDNFGGQFSYSPEENADMELVSRVANKDNMKNSPRRRPMRVFAIAHIDNMYATTGFAQFHNFDHRSDQRGARFS